MSPFKNIDSGTHVTVFFQWKRIRIHWWNFHEPIENIRVNDRNVTQRHRRNSHSLEAVITKSIRRSHCCNVRMTKRRLQKQRTIDRVPLLQKKNEKKEFNQNAY